MYCAIHPGNKIDFISARQQEAQLACSECRQERSYITIDQVHFKSLEFQENPLLIFDLSNFKHTLYGQLIATTAQLQQTDLEKVTEFLNQIFLEWKTKIDLELSSIYKQIEVAIDQFKNLKSKFWFVSNDFQKLLSTQEISEEIKRIQKSQNVSAFNILLQRFSSICCERSDSVQQFLSQFEQEINEVHHKLYQSTHQLNEFFMQPVLNHSEFQCNIQITFKKQEFKKPIISQPVVPFQDSQLLSDKNRVYVQNLFRDTANTVNLIYQSQTQSLTGEAFARYCFDQGPTVIIFKLPSEEILGAYNPQSWQNIGVYPNNQASKLVLFSVTKQEEFYLKTQCDQALKCKLIPGFTKFEVEISLGQDDINIILPLTNKLSSDPCFVFSYFPLAFEVPKHLRIPPSHMDNASNQYLLGAPNRQRILAMEVYKMKY